LSELRKSAMSKQKSIGIEEAIEQKFLVEFNRKPFDKSKEFGFVLDWNDQFTLIQIFDHDWFAVDGYCVFKNESIKSFRVYDKEEDFLNEVVKLKKIEPAPVPEISIESWEAVLQSVNDNFDLISVESELIYKNQCNIGRLEKLGKKSFSLIEIYGDACWNDSPTKYKFKDLTKVCFNEAYDKTLWEISESRKK
jgi:hypothetical protein